ncbi:mannosyltransferase family protein [Chitinilyticum piscinae]|uniref:Glycosyltransferase family 39 protein n=1 Tax=Chitinilyticum piscinae TaxID=2866724 RepID=A0A8J7FMM5_9NEIS|nr:mannosyltransferase family protein [Chitinilyticum piscinae]MBE9609316.1 glycosyltransferase family 39 protein [Chitinilyticum piscinae]
MIAFITFLCFACLLMAAVVKLHDGWQTPHGQLLRPPALPDTTLGIIAGVVVLALLARGSVWLYGWLSFILIKGQFVSPIESFREIWVRWDAFHYLGIADQGYVNQGDERNRLVFFPLYPLLIAALKLLGLNSFQAATLLSVSFFCAACVMLYRLTERETGDKQCAWLACALLAFYPFSFFYGMPYTESLFLLLTISFFWFMRQQAWLLAGISGMLAALTRNQGLLLLAPLVIELVLQWQARTLQQPRRAVLALLLIPCGFMLYLLLNYWVSGNPLQFLIYQKINWQQSFGWLPNTLSGAAERLLTGDFKLGLGTWLPTIAMFFAALAVLAGAYRQLPASYLAYASVYLLISYSPTWLLSGPRYLGGLFVLAIAAAIIAARHPLLRTGLFAAMLLGIGLFVPLYLQWVVY